jgi:hypothetical protein
LENALLDKEETITINDMALNFQEDIRSFIRSLPDIELKHDPMSEEAYFYGLRNFLIFMDQDISILGFQNFSKKKP